MKNCFSSIFLNEVIDMAAELLLNKFSKISKDKIKNCSNFARKIIYFSSAICFINKKNGVTMATILAENIFIKF